MIGIVIYLSAIFSLERYPDILQLVGQVEFLAVYIQF